MALDVRTIIEQVFKVNRDLNRCYSSYRFNNNPISLRKYMEIPVQEDVFEIPVFAIMPFVYTLCRDPNADMIIAQLETYDCRSTYSSLNKVMEDVLRESFFQTTLVRIDITKVDKPYYGTYGAVFDRNFNPIMLCTWEIEKYKTEHTGTKYFFRKPIVRLTPSCFIEQDDALQRFLAKKIPTETLSLAIDYPNIIGNGVFPYKSTSIQAKLVVDDIPFKIREADVPSISTSNSELLQAAIDHIDEILPCQ